MAYFSNGSEGMVFDSDCGDCILGGGFCPIFAVQSIFNYQACNVPIARAILNQLVKQDKDGVYIGCQMKPLLDKYKEKEDPNQGKLFG